MIGKIFGAGLGWVIGGGPIGAVIGLAIGAAFDKGSKTLLNEASNVGQPKTETTTADFAAVLVVVSAAVMKADGKVVKSELEYVKKFFRDNFGPEMGQEQLLLLREVLKQDYNLSEVCGEIRSRMRIAEKRLLLQYLFGIAKADGHVDNREVQVIQTIARYIGISSQEFLMLKAMYVGAEYGGSYGGGYSSSNSSGRRRKPKSGVTLSSAYQILGVSATATTDNVKKAYRKLVIKYHPDKVQHLGEDQVKAAKEKFQKVQEAYDKIKEDRGIS